MDPLEPFRRVGQDLFDPARLATAMETALALASIGLGAWLLLRVSLGVLRRTAAWQAGHPAARMTPIVEGLLRYTILFTAIVLMLTTVHINITPVLASATVLGVALGVGAQQLIRDLLAGIFMLSEGIIQVGDLVRLELPSGTSDIGVIERITLRFTQIRKASGELVTVSNGSVAKIGNLSRDYARAIVEVLIPYSADTSAALQALADAAKAWAAAHPHRHAEPQLGGVTNLRDTGVVLQCSVLVSPGEQDTVASELRQHVLEALARRGITPGAGAPQTAP